MLMQSAWDKLTSYLYKVQNELKRQISFAIFITVTLPWKRFDVKYIFYNGCTNKSWIPFYLDALLLSIPSLTSNVISHTEKNLSFFKVLTFFKVSINLLVCLVWWLLFICVTSASLLILEKLCPLLWILLLLHFLLYFHFFFQEITFLESQCKLEFERNPVQVNRFESSFLNY